MGSGTSESEGIEQEWLDRTHHVHAEFFVRSISISKEFAVLRAEFIKHRYGKVIHTNPSKDMKMTNGLLAFITGYGGSWRGLFFL